MTLKKIYVYGAGGHGKVVADALRARGHAVAGFVDDSAYRCLEPVLGLPVLETNRWLREQQEPASVGVALGIGDNHARHHAAERCRRWGFVLVSAIHPAAVVSAAISIGAGTVIMARATLNADAKVGFGVIVNTGAVVEHDCVVGDYAHVSPNAALGGAARLGAFSHLGLGAVVLPGVFIGSRSVIGAGAVVVRDVPGGVTAMGVPARIASKIIPAIAART